LASVSGDTGILITVLLNRTQQALTALFLLPTLVLAQELHTFKNGGVADADKLNESLQYILNNASGGCSATQRDNSVLIECADGSSGVIAGAGTVVVYPEGTIGTIPTDSYNTGDIVVVDANDVILGPAQSNNDGGYWLADGNIYNDNANANTVFAPSCIWSLWYKTQDCSGLVFVTALVKIGDTWFVESQPGNPQRLLMKSRRRTACYSGGQLGSAGDCEVIELTPNSISLGVEYTPAPEILNAAYPVRLEQLP